MLGHIAKLYRKTGGARGAGPCIRVAGSGVQIQQTDGRRAGDCDRRND